MFSVQPEPHPFSAAETIKKKQVLRSRIILMRLQVKKLMREPEPYLIAATAPPK
jgi:hypothetical protein